MAINKTAVNQNQIYKRALSAEEKKRMQAGAASAQEQIEAQQEQIKAQQEQIKAQQERARALASGDTRAISQLLRQESLQRLASQGVRGAAQTLDAEKRFSAMKQAQTRQAQPKTQAPYSSPAAPVQLKDYTWWSWMGSNDMTTMNDEDRANWQSAMKGWEKGDYTSFNDNFQKSGNWASYVDDNGSVSGMLRYVGDGIGGYVPVNGGQLLQSGFSGDLSNYAFYGPDGSVYTADAGGRLTKSGTWSMEEPYSALKNSIPYKMLKGAATEEERADWIRKLDPYDPEKASTGRTQPPTPGETGQKTAPDPAPTPAQKPSAEPQRASAQVRPETDPAPAPPRTSRPAGPADGGIDWQSYLDRFDYGEAPEWAGSDYERKRDEALRRAQEMRWSYDPEADPVWQAYRKQYLREGRRSAQDALGQYAAMTGGAPSSYAMTAASQAGDYYAARLSDKLPELYQSAYERYLRDYQHQLELSDRYADYANGEYDRYRDRLGQWNTDRQFQYGLDRDAVGDARYDEETAYDRAWNEEERDYARSYQARRDAISDDRYDQEWAQQLREYADAQGWKALEWQQYLRDYGDRLSEKERQWAYQMARDAQSDRRYAQEKAAEQEQTAWQRALAESEQAYDRGRDALADQRQATQWQQELRQYEDTRYDEAMAFLQRYGYVGGRYAEILGVPSGTTLEAFRAQQGAAPAAASGSGYAPVRQQNSAPAESRRPSVEEQPEEASDRFGGDAWEDGRRKTRAAAELQAEIAYGWAMRTLTKANILTMVYGAADRGEIENYEVPFLLKIAGVDTRSEPAANPRSEGGIRQYTK